MECRRVHALRPRFSTSGGQSACEFAGMATTPAAPATVLRADLLCEVKAANEVHCRHLVTEAKVNRQLLEILATKDGKRAYGFPSLPRTTPFGSLLVA